MLSLQQKYDLIEEENKINGLFFKELQMIFADRDEKILELGKIRRVEDYNAFMKVRNMSDISIKSTQNSTNNQDNFSFGENTNYSKELFNTMLPIGIKIKSGSNIGQKKQPIEFNSDKRTFLDRLEQPNSRFSPKNVPSDHINSYYNAIPVDTKPFKFKQTRPIEEYKGQSAFKKAKLD